MQLICCLNINLRCTCVFTSWIKRRESRHIQTPTHTRGKGRTNRRDSVHQSISVQQAICGDKGHEKKLRCYVGTKKYNPLTIFSNHTTMPHKLIGKSCTHTVNYIFLAYACNAAKLSIHACYLHVFHTFAVNWF